tara:strand:+ start:1508 stop:2410 length:903 start_codon:yes stop_codon:yes gene_type:complete
VKDDVRCFVEIVRQGSYAAASKELGVSAATLTRRITGLEERLGVRLLDRTPRLCRPTADGEVFYERCEAILDDMGAAEEEMRVRGGRPVGRLRVAAPISFGRRHLAPLIGEFHSLHPEVQVELELTDETDLLRQESYDVSVEIGRPDRGDTISRLLLESPRVVCASPGYLERHGRPERPADLLEHRCLHLIRDGRRLDHWMFQVDGVVETVASKGYLASNSGDVLHEWALAGRGIGLKAHWDIEEALTSGALVPLLEDFAVERADVFVLYADRRHLPNRVRAFLDFLYERMGPLDLERRP